MLMEGSATLVASSHELGRASDLFGVHIDLTGLLPESLSTVLRARLVVADSLPSAYSDLFLHGASCFELFVLANCVELIRSTSRVEARNTATGRRWSVVWSSLTVGVWEEAQVSTS